MATFPNRNPMMSEANTEASASHFAWFHQANFFSAARTNLNPLQATKISPGPGLAIPPIRSLAPESKPEKNVEFVTKPTKARKQRPSIKSSDPVAAKVLKPKRPKKNPSVSKKTKGPNLPAANREKKNLNIVMDGTQFDFSGVPSPVCSCTGVAKVCYKWGAGGWQSSCCTTSISEYPLPMSSSRPGSRMAGRKMSNGAYSKLLLKLAADGYDLSHPVDLRNHWARHGTNKFVTIK